MSTIIKPTETSKDYGKPRLRAFAMVVAAALLVYGTTTPFDALSFQPSGGDNALAVLGRLVLIALFVERAMEVLVELWRGAEKNRKKHEVDRIQKALGDASIDSQGRNKLEVDLDMASEDLSDWRAVTTRIALWSGFLFGVLISIAGVRAMQALFSAAPEGSTQLMLFQGLDILLTAALISGGSEGIHKMTSVYKTFMEASEKKIEASARRSENTQ
jgi:hypothetical protein